MYVDYLRIRVGVLGHAIRILYILTEDLHDLGDLIGAVFSEEEDAVHNQFAHDASRRPNINFEPVVIASQNQLKKAGKTGSTVSSLDSHPPPPLDLKNANIRSVRYGEFSIY